MEGTTCCTVASVGRFLERMFSMNPIRRIAGFTGAALLTYALGAYCQAPAVPAPAAQPSAQQPPESQPAPFNFQVNVNKVLVPVVVRDKQGQSIGDLKKEDFQVLDRGKPHEISAFTVQQRGVAETVTADGAASSRQQPGAADAAAQPPATPRRFIVFLFDDLNLRFEDLARTQSAGVKAITGLSAPSDMAAVVSTSGLINSGLTQDRAKLQAAITSLRPAPPHRFEATDSCISVDYFDADQILNHPEEGGIAEKVGEEAAAGTCVPSKNSTTNTSTTTASTTNTHGPKASGASSMSGDVGGTCDLTGSTAWDCPDPVVQRVVALARQAKELGRQDVLGVYATIQQLAGKMATLPPSQRMIVLVSSGLMPVEPETRQAESDTMNIVAASNVTISAIDGRGLYTTFADATERQLTTTPLLTEWRQTKSQIALMSMADLANATGGTFFRNSNDMDAGFERVMKVPEYVYELELSLGGMKADGIYHRLDVKVDRKDVQVVARPGYFVAKPQKNKK
jgi:VWFA-related protein